MKPVFLMLISLIFVSPLYSQEGPDFIYADSIDTMPGDTFEIAFYYRYPYQMASIGMLPFIQPHFDVIDYSLEGGILESLNCEVTFRPGNIFLFAVACSIPAAFDERLLILTAVTQTNLSPNRYNDLIFSRVVDEYGWLEEDTAYVCLNIQNPPFQRGDVSHDGTLDSTDIRILTNCIFQGQSLGSPIGIGDMDLDGRIDIEDVLLLRNQIYGLRR
jgi:hypothetical protein